MNFHEMYTQSFQLSIQNIKGHATEIGFMTATVNFEMC